MNSPLALTMRLRTWVFALGLSAVAGSGAMAQGQPAHTPADIIARGEYLARAGDCVA